MHGIPNVLQTRDDFDLCLILVRASAAPASAVCPHFQGLLSSSCRYVFDRVLDDGEEPTGPLPEYCVAETEDPSNHIGIRTQLKQEIDTSARLFTLGYTVDEVMAVIAELEAETEHGE